MLLHLRLLLLLRRLSGSKVSKALHLIGLLLLHLLLHSGRLIKIGLERRLPRLHPLLGLLHRLACRRHRHHSGLLRKVAKVGLEAPSG